MHLLSLRSWLQLQRKKKNKMIIPVKNGFKIRSEKGILWPKVYATQKAAQKRIDQLERFKKSNDPWLYVILEKGKNLIERFRERAKGGL